MNICKFQQCCFCRWIPCSPREDKPFNEILGDLKLDDARKRLLKFRYGERLANIDFRSARDGCIQNFFRIFVTIGSLLIPALISIYPNEVDCDNKPEDWTLSVIQWISWVIGVGVSIANGLISLFALDKASFMQTTTKARLRSEFFQQAQLTGRYSGQQLPRSIKATHENQFTQFTNEVEKILLSVVIEEQHRERVKNHHHASRDKEIGGMGVGGYRVNRHLGIPVSGEPVGNQGSDTNSGGDLNSVDLDIDQEVVNMVAGELSTSSGGTQDDIIVPSHHTSRMMPPTPADHARFRRGSRKKLRHHHNHNRSHTSKTPTSLKHVREQIRYKENQIERAAEHEMKNPSPGKLLVNMEEVREVDFTEPIFDISALRNVPADDGAEESRPPTGINKAGKDKGNLETTKKTA